jgi:hypothetical protein
VRGKLRDKRTANKRDVFKREVLERRRPYKRDARMAILLSQEIDNEDYELDTTVDGEEPDAKLPQQK